MSILVRPAEAGWNMVVSMQMEKEAEDAAKGVKRLIAAAPSSPYPPGGPSNLNDMVKLKKYYEMFKYNFSNKLDNLKPNINKQSIAKYLKYFA